MQTFNRYRGLMRLHGARRPWWEEWIGVPLPTALGELLALVSVLAALTVLTVLIGPR